MKKRVQQFGLSIMRIIARLTYWRIVPYRVRGYSLLATNNTGVRLGDEAQVYNAVEIGRYNDLHFYQAERQGE